MPIFHLPDFGEGLAEARLIAWYVSVGDEVAEDQLMGAFETDKAVVDVPSPWPGRVAKLFCSRGELVKTGAAIVEIEPYLESSP